MRESGSEVAPPLQNHRRLILLEFSLFGQFSYEAKFFWQKPSFKVATGSARGLCNTDEYKTDSTSISVLGD